MGLDQNGRIRLPLVSENVPPSAGDWMQLTFGVYNMSEILPAVRHDDWQRLRISMKNLPLYMRYNMMVRWLNKNNFDERSKVQVTNYVNALRRGGMVPPQ